MPKQVLSDSDKVMIAYFIKEKGDVTRWTDWDICKPLLEKEFPELIFALQFMDMAERNLKSAIDKMMEGNKHE